jgi:AcrR family transcriptional regulator
VQNSTSHRERKKARTREALITAARRLYRERGFDGVTIAAISEEAGISTRTFFSYFETKEDVFLGAGDDRLERLVQAIRDRNPGEPILTAAKRELLRAPKRQPQPQRQRPELAELLAHPSITARLRERWNRWEDVLAECIAVEVRARPGDPEPKVVAAAITAAIRVAAATALTKPTRRATIAQRVFGLLASGMASYGARAK